jgi:hypothetical protein
MGDFFVINITKCVYTGLAGLLICVYVQADPFDESFYPYKDGPPTYPGLEVGMTIDQSNVEQFKEILAPGEFKFVKDGSNKIKIAETIAFPLYQGYIDASRKNIGAITLTDKGLLSANWQSGRAFPHPPDQNDPQSGLKLIWNYQRGFNAGDSETINPFWWTYKNAATGKVERTLKWDWHFLNWMNRTQFDPIGNMPDNPSNIYRSLYSKVLEPFDLKNTQLLIHRYQDDLHRDNVWLYLGFQRRVRRLASGQITDAFLGTDIMIEDFEGYNGRVSDYTWEYKGTQLMLTPFVVRTPDLELEAEAPGTPDGFKFIKFGGQGGCFPQVPWMLRKVDVVEGKPKEKSHPLSRRVIYLDRETSVMAQLNNYDRNGKLWKTFNICKTYADSHHPKNHGSGVPIEDCAVLYDVQAQHCTTLQFRSIINAEENPQSIFNVQNLRKQGR